MKCEECKYMKSIYHRRDTIFLCIKSDRTIKVMAKGIPASLLQTPIWCELNGGKEK